jgi:hypothetical integral membrane protein (TIGR02206 family)
MDTTMTVGRFEAYGTSHLAVIVVLLVGAVLLVRLARARPGLPADRLGRAVALTILLVMVPLQVLYLTPAYWSLQHTLPLNLCDLAWMVSAYALWTHRRWAVALTYYWGLTLSTQAVITPDLAEDFPDPSFVLFWGMHLLIVWSAVYVTWGLRLTPDWRSYRTAFALTGIWAATALGFNQVAGTNYGYLSAKPPTESILDLLGPWPWYVAAEVVSVSVAWALVTWPWVALARRRAMPTPAAAGGGPRS